MHASIGRRASALVAALVCAQQAGAQVFVNSPGNIPSGSPGNNSRTEQVDFADIDNDGDWDVGVADGGDCCNDQNRLWVNQGGLQGGTLGFFADATAAQAPLISDNSRDIEFVDFDSDGDPDIHSTNTSTLVNQACRFWTNQGGLQAGSAGSYVDETALRWVGLGGAGSSVPPSSVLGSGGFITFGQDQDFADVDNDGDLDLVAAVVGGGFSGSEPTRLFLNDGLGFFSEFNPSGFQLGVTPLEGNPALWAEGLQQSGTINTTGAFADIMSVAIEVSLGDIDGDLDIDVLLGERMQTPRMFRNRMVETGALAFRDVTGLTWPQGWGNGTGKYEQDFADFDNDDDIDLYGMNWSAPAFNDLTLRGAGDGTFVQPTPLPGSNADEDGADFVDYDSDGDLDIHVAGFSGGDKLYQNVFAGGPLAFVQVTDPVSGLGLSAARDVDTADVDGDGDYDLLRGCDLADTLLLNVLGIPDTTAPRLARLELLADHQSGLASPVRVQHYDNAPDYLAVGGTHELVYSDDGAPFVSTPMTWSGGQILRGELPASAVGNVRYFARSTDEHGNTGESNWASVNTAGGCGGQISTYCTGKLNTDGCVPKIEFLGVPRLGGFLNFVLRGTGVLANANGLLIYSKSGANSAPFNGGTLCVGAGLLRTPGQNSGGAGPCGGLLQFDFNSWIFLGGDPGLVAGQKVWAQYWYRDVASLGGTGLTNGVTFTICP
jgi:hypothetical protein